MTTELQREVIQDKSAFLIKECTAGDKDATEYLWAIAHASRILDDIVDQDKPIKPEDFLNLAEYLFVKIHSNKFFRDNYDTLVSQHITIWNTWMAANHAEKYGDNIDKQHARTWRNYLNELLPLVALLTQGWNQMKKVSAHIRIYHSWYDRMKEELR